MLSTLRYPTGTAVPRFWSLSQKPAGLADRPRSMQSRWYCLDHPVLHALLLRGIADLLDLHPDSQILAGQRVVTIQGKLPIFDLGDVKSLDVARLALHLHLGAHMTELWRDIIDDIGKGEIRVIGAHALIRSHFELDPVAGAFSHYCSVHSADELGLATVDIAYGQAGLLQHTAGLVANTIGEGYELSVLGSA